MFRWILHAPEGPPSPHLFRIFSTLLPIDLLTPEEDNFLSKALVFHCFVVFRRMGEHISLDLFYFVNLSCYCSLILQYSVVVFTIGNFPRDHQTVLSQIIINVTIQQYVATRQREILIFSVESSCLQQTRQRDHPAGFAT